MSAEDKPKKKIGRPREWTDARIEALAADLFKWFTEDESRLFYGSWMVNHGLHWEHLSRFRSVSDVFRETCKKVDALQEERLVLLGLKNPVMPIFVLKNKHGWADKQEVKTEQHITHAEDRKQLEELDQERLKDRLRALTESSNN